VSHIRASVLRTLRLGWRDVPVAVSEGKPQIDGAVEALDRECYVGGLSLRDASLPYPPSKLGPIKRVLAFAAEYTIEAPTARGRDGGPHKGLKFCSQDVCTFFTTLRRRIVDPNGP
jgi:hypothetical protein